MLVSMPSELSPLMSNAIAIGSRGSQNSMKFAMDSKPTKRRDLIIFGVALLIIAYVFRDELIFFIQDKGSLIAFDSEYDEFIVAADKLRPMATVIQDKCKQASVCPEIPAGWTRQNDSSESISGDMVYVPLQAGTPGNDEKARPFNAFRITYDYRPGWQALAHGGVDAELVLERSKRPQRKP
jgi:hypothetical protein